MSGDTDGGGAAGAGGADRSEPAGSHLDEDPEALEDPVHRGDATHQHDVHARAAAARAHPDEGDGSTAGTPAGGG